MTLMRAVLRLNGRVASVVPPAPEGQPEHDLFTKDYRVGFFAAWKLEAPGGWEEVEIETRGSGLFSVRFVMANRQLSIDPNGELGSTERGAIGSYEIFYGVHAGPAGDIPVLLYRVIDWTSEADPALAERYRRNPVPVVLVVDERVSA